MSARFVMATPVCSALVVVTLTAVLAETNCLLWMKKQWAGVKPVTKEVSDG